jgi:hypothetical protein
MDCRPGQKHSDNIACKIGISQAFKKIHHGSSNVEIRPFSRKPILIWLIVSQLLALLSLIFWMLIAGLSVMTFDSGVTPEAWTFVITVWSYPIWPLVLAIASWIAYARKKDKLAGILTYLPACSAIDHSLSRIKLSLFHVTVKIRFQIFPEIKETCLNLQYSYSTFRICVRIVAPEPPMFCAMPICAPSTWVSPHSPRNCCTTSTI